MRTVISKNIVTFQQESIKVLGAQTRDESWIQLLSFSCEICISKWGYCED